MDNKLSINNYLPIRVNNISLKYKILILVIAAIYALYLANLPIYAFKDRLNYIDYTFNSEYIFNDRWTYNLISFFTNEPLFLLINIFLSKFFSPENSLRILIGIPAFIIAYSILRVNPRYFFILFLLLFIPQIIKNHIIHLRQGVAIAFFLLGWFNNNKKVKYFFLSLTPFVHSSFFIIIPIIFLNEYFKNNVFFNKFQIEISIFFAVFISLSMSFFASILDARQQVNEAEEISGLGFLFWSLLLVLFLMDKHNFKKRAIIPISLLILYLVNYFTIAVAARIFESGIILVLLSGLYITPKRRLIFFTFLFLYAVLTYYLRYNLPYFGWGTAG